MLKIYAPQSFLNVALAKTNTRTMLWQVVLVTLGALFIVFSAKTKVPFYPVPLTLQTLTIMLLAVGYGRNMAVASVIAYLALGLVGFPVFANTPPKVAGPAYFLGATGGFLLGFIALAAITGYAAERARNMVTFAFGLVAANAALFALGLSGLALFGYVSNNDKLVGFNNVIAAGFATYYVEALLKMGLVFAAFIGLNSFIKRAK